MPIGQDDVPGIRERADVAEDREGAASGEIGVLEESQQTQIRHQADDEPGPAGAFLPGGVKSPRRMEVDDGGEQYQDDEGRIPGTVEDNARCDEQGNAPGARRELKAGEGDGEQKKIGRRIELQGLPRREYEVRDGWRIYHEGGASGSRARVVVRRRSW